MIRNTRVLEVVTDAVISGSTSQQSSALQDLISPAVAAAAGASDDAATRQLSRVLYELGWQTLSGAISPSDTVAALRKASTSDSGAVPGDNKAATAAADVLVNTLVDVLWLLGTELGCAEGVEDVRGTEEWSRLCTLVKLVAQPKSRADGGAPALATAAHLKCVLEFPLLQGANLIADSAAFQKKLIRENTKNLYTQTKYNLLSEVTEGYAKVTTLLSQLSRGERASSDQVSADLRTLVGYFELDPNRVLDLVLDALEHFLSSTAVGEDAAWTRTVAAYSAILDEYRLEHLAQIMGFKLQEYHPSPKQPEENVTQAEDSGASKTDTERSDPGALVMPNPPTPPSLALLAARLVATERLTLSALSPHLVPELSAMAKDYTARDTRALREAQALGRVSLTLSSEAAAAKRAAEAAASAAAVKADTASDASNQWLALLLAMLRAGLWDTAKGILALMQQHGITPTKNEPVARALCSLMDRFISNVVTPLAPVTFGGDGSTSCDSMDVSTEEIEPTVGLPLRPATSIDACAPTLAAMAKCLGHQLHLDPGLYMRLCRLLEHAAGSKDKQSSAESNATTLPPALQTVLCEALLPALPLLPPNPALLDSLWRVLDHMGYAERYLLYAHWRASVYTSSPSLVRAHKLADMATKKLLRRVSKENTKQIGRGLAKHAHSNPLVVFDAILGQIQSYDNLIQPMVEALKYTSELGRDILGFAIVSALSSHGEGTKLKPDGTNVSLWLSSLARFAGAFFRRNYSTDLGGLLQYLVEQLKSRSGLDLLVLKELLTRVGGVETFEDVSDAQLDSRTVGSLSLLAKQTAIAAGKSPSKRAVARLRESLFKNKLIRPLLVLMAQQRSHILFKDGSKHTKLLGRLFDTCQMTLEQFVQFLLASYRSPDAGGVSTAAAGTAAAALAYAEVVPSWGYLVGTCHLDHAIAFHIVRPALRATAGQEARAAHAAKAATDGKPKGGMQWQAYPSALLTEISNRIPAELSGFDKIYTMFWCSETRDVYQPIERYEAELARLRKTARSERGKTPLDRAAEVAAKRADHTAAELEGEKAQHAAHFSRVQRSFQAAKAEWFNGCPDALDTTTATAIVQHCIHPRASLSAENAIFCAKFFLKLHALNPPKFVSWRMLHAIMTLVPATLPSCSEREAGFLGLLLRESWHVALRWATHDGFQKECEGKVGWAKKGEVARVRQMHKKKQKTNSAVDCAQEMLPGEEALGFEAYTALALVGEQSSDTGNSGKKEANKKKIDEKDTSEPLALRSWHQIHVTAFVKMLEKTDEYIAMRNALIVLKTIATQFPSRRSGWEPIERLAGRIAKEEEERGDLQLMSRTYHALLKKRESEMIEDMGERQKPVSKPKRALDASAKAFTPEAERNTKRSASAAGLDKDGGSGNAVSRGRDDRDHRDRDRPSDRIGDRASDRAGDRRDVARGRDDRDHRDRDRPSDRVGDRAGDRASDRAGDRRDGARNRAPVTSRAHERDREDRGNRDRERNGRDSRPHERDREDRGNRDRERNGRDSRDITRGRAPSSAGSGRDRDVDSRKRDRDGRTARDREREREANANMRSSRGRSPPGAPVTATRPQRSTPTASTDPPPAKRGRDSRDSRDSSRRGGATSDARGNVDGGRGGRGDGGHGGRGDGGRGGRGDGGRGGRGDGGRGARSTRATRSTRR